MYEKCKIYLNAVKSQITVKRFIMLACAFLLIIGACQLIDGYFTARGNYQRAVERLEQAQEQQRESLELNRSIQHSIDRSADLSREAGARIERSAQYNQQIGGRISQSQGNLSEARSYLERNAEIIRRVEEQNRAGQPHNQATTNATQSIPSSGSGSDNRSSNSSMTER